MKNNETMIHIKAESKVMSVNCIASEKKALSILTDIRNNFINMKQKFEITDDKLIVQTCVHNPKFF